MAELCRTDIEAQWLAHNLRFWNNLCDQPPGSLHFELLMDAQWEAMLAKTRNWVWWLRRACRRVRFEMPLSTERAHRVNVSHVMRLYAAAQQQARDALSVCPRTCPSAGAAKCKYWRWFGRTPRQQQQLQIFRQRQSQRRMGIYLRFRLGCSSLPAVRGQRNGTERRMRNCQQCGDAEAVGDERHMVFECSAVQHIREEHMDLFWDGQTMSEFANQPDQIKVMDFIVSCFDSFNSD